MARSPPEPGLAVLEEELTCSICLSLFSSPVTVPCGHNFCGSCLESAWAGPAADFSCPQCRATFAGRPQLQKNTVLCRVVEQLRGCAGAGERDGEGEAGSVAADAPGDPPVRCDSCLRAPAARTCLTCTASFCAEHLRPHQDSPAFRDHQLCAPLRDLQRRKCPQHNKLLEFFCRQHGCCICSLCLLGHKLCYTSPLQLAKANAESALKKRLVELHNQCEKAAQAMKAVKIHQSQTTETACRKIDLIRNEFSEIKALIEERENQILKVIADEEKRVWKKFDYIYGVLGNKKNDIQSLRDQIEVALTEQDDVLFLKKAAALQRTPTKSAFIPEVEMDQNLIHSTCQSAINLKDTVKLAVTRCREERVEAKLTLRKTKAPPLATPNRTFVGRQTPGPYHASKEKNFPQTPAASQVEADTKEKKKPGKIAPDVGTSNAAAAVSTKELIDSFLKKSREELLQYAVNIMLDCNTAHNKVILSDGYTRMSVSDTSLNYNNHPQRFTDCFQVLGLQCFKKGIHYWEVELQQSNFCGIGICYGSMDRQGPESRLGRNSSSWCIEWFNSKISSWHNDVEKCLPAVHATKIGVLLHCEGGFVIFMAVGKKHNLIYKFKAEFTEALYPAFWLFSSGTVLSLCQMKQ